MLSTVVLTWAFYGRRQGPETFRGELPRPRECEEPMNFNEAWATYSRLKEQFDQGTLSAQQFENQAAGLRVQDPAQDVYDASDVPSAQTVFSSPLP